ncbi:MAG: amidohydrolase family protein [Clostridia bacterium]|nr:amidohydrolase family protein [Clostridia bacterium]
MYIIDAHAHIFPEKIAQKAVQNIGNFYGLAMNNKGEAKDLIESGKQAGISRFIVSSTATQTQQVRAINSFISHSVNKFKELTGLITLHPDNTIKEIDAEISFAQSNGLKGIKLHPDFQKFCIDDKRAYNIYASAQGVLPILFHTGDKRYSYSTPQRLAKVAKIFKKLKCVGAHFGGYSEWEKVSCYKGTPNVYFDTCSSLSFLSADRAQAIIAELGADRFMFGTDFPMWQHKAELEKFFNLDLSQSVKEKILYKNALNFYGIK